MSQVPTSRTPVHLCGYAILDTPTFTLLDQIFRLLREPESGFAVVLKLRCRKNDSDCAVRLVRIRDIGHEHERGAIFFSGPLDDGRCIQAYIFALPLTDDPTAIGSATITTIEQE